MHHANPFHLESPATSNWKRRFFSRLRKLARAYLLRVYLRAGKAIIALARKFLGIIYRTLKNNWVFEDFSNFVLAEES